MLTDKKNLWFTV